MPKQTLNTLKAWFARGLKPTAEQFSDMFDSFFHKDDKVPAASVDGLQELLDDKADVSEAKLSTDLYVTIQEKNTWNGKQDAKQVTELYVSTEEKTAWNGKQDAKQATELYVSQAEKTAWSGKQDAKQATELYVSQAEKNAWGDKQVLLTKNGLGNFPSSFKLPYACTVKAITKSDNCTAYSITIAGTVYTTTAIVGVNIPANTSIVINDLTATGGVIANALLTLTQNA